MKNIKVLAAGLLALGLITAPSNYAAEPPTPPEMPETPEQPQAPERPEAPDTLARPEIPADAKELLAKALQERMQYLSARADMLKSIRGANAEIRAELRAKIKASREEFLALQRENRSDFRQSLDEIRERLADHTEVVDQIKEEAKAKAKDRRGAGDE
jgi:hypothetical protein